MNVTDQICPQNWRLRSLDSLGKVVSGATPSTRVPEFWNGDISWITPADLSQQRTPFISATERSISHKGLESCAASLVPRQNIVISSRAPIGYIAIPTMDFATNQGCKSLYLNKQQDYLFHYYNLCFHVRRLKEKGEGTTFAEISKTALESIQLPVPDSILVQSTIGEILITVDRAIASIRALIAKHDRIRVGLIEVLLTHGIDEQGHLRNASAHRFKASLIGVIPEEWTCQTVDECLRNGTLADVQDGNHGELHPKASDFVQQGVPFVMASDISRGEIDLEQCKRITKEQYDRLRVGHSQAGDVLVSHKASIGFVALVKESDGLVMLTPQVTYYRVGRHGRLLPAFLRFLLQGQRFQSALLTLAKQSTRDYVGILLQRTIPLAFPTRIDEQEAIAKILGCADARVRSLTAFLNILQKMKTGLMQDLLTGRISVEQLVKTERIVATA